MPTQLPMTPYRKTTVRFDLTEPTVAEPAWAISRGAEDIAKAVAPDGTDASSNVFRAHPDSWALEPFQEQPHYVHERDDGSSNMRLTDFTTITGYAEHPRWRSPVDLTGATTGADAHLLTTGDYFLGKTVAGGASWNQSLTADITAFGQIAAPTTDIKVDRHAVSTANLAENECIYLRFDVPSILSHSPDSVLTHYFGGPATSEGHGQFGVVFQGNGLARIYERINAVWTYRDAFRYCEPNRVAGVHHSVLIWVGQQLSGQGGIIGFRVSHVDYAASGGSFLDAYKGKADAPRFYFYPVVWKKTVGGGSARTKVTGQGHVRIDMRRDHRVRWQIGRIRFPATGLLVDQAFVVPFPLSTRSDLLLSWAAVIPTGTTLSGRLYNADTNAELTEVSATGNTRTYSSGYKQSHVYAKFTFTASSDATKTPALFGYAVQRDGYSITPTGLTEFSAPIGVSTVLTDINISGPESDMSHETASITIQDMGNALSLLRTRASIRTRVQTQMDSADASKVTVLLDGFTQQARATRKGTEGRTFPSPNWNHLDLTVMGMWIRAHETLSFVQQDWILRQYTTVPPKVTDIVRAMLLWPGFTAAQIDVPDNPIRLWVPPGGEDSTRIDPLTNVIEYCAKILHDYLGWYLLWDGNVGVTGTPNTTGMIRARPPSVPTTVGGTDYTYLWEFLTIGPSGKVPHLPASYANTGAYDTGGKKNWTGSNSNVGQTFVQKGTLVSWVKPPEANFVWVSTTGQVLPNKSGRFQFCNWAANPKSYDFFADSGGTVKHTADPAHPDYLGRFVPLVIADPGLSGDSPEDRQRTVDWLVRRYYDFTCHALKMLTFTAPLVFVEDTTDILKDSGGAVRAGQANNPRPLRYGDPVKVTDQGVTSNWLVRNANPVYTHDEVQWCHYELQSVINPALQN